MIPSLIAAAPGNCTAFAAAYALDTLPEVPHSLLLRTNESLYVWHYCSSAPVQVDAAWGIKATDNSYMANSLLSNTLFFANEIGVSVCTGSAAAAAAAAGSDADVGSLDDRSAAASVSAAACSFIPAPQNMGTVVKVVPSPVSAAAAMLCTAEGVFELSNGVILRPSGFPSPAYNTPCTALAMFSDGSIAFANGGLYMYRLLPQSLLPLPVPGQAQLWNNYSVCGVLSDNVTDLEFDSSGQLWVGSALGLDIQTLTPAAKLTWWRVNGYYYGLPFGNVTSVVRGALPGEMFISTLKGLIRYFFDPGSFDTYGPFNYYYYGPRYYSGDAVGAVAVDTNSDGMSVVSYVSDQGMACCCLSCLMCCCCCCVPVGHSSSIIMLALHQAWLCLGSRAGLWPRRLRCMNRSTMNDTIGTV